MYEKVTVGIYMVKISYYSKHSNRNLIKFGSLGIKYFFIKQLFIFNRLSKIKFLPKFVLHHLLKKQRNLQANKLIFEFRMSDDNIYINYISITYQEIVYNLKMN